jgi:hypothetical protein
MGTREQKSTNFIPVYLDIQIHNTHQFRSQMDQLLEVDTLMIKIKIKRHDVHRRRRKVVNPATTRGKPARCTATLAPCAGGSLAAPRSKAAGSDDAGHPLQAATVALPGCSLPQS